MIRGLALSAVSAALLCAQNGFLPDGRLEFPADYREWVYLSSGLNMTYGPLASEARRESPPFENVFVTRAAYKEFLNTGKWPDRTMFALEIRSSQSKGSINQDGRFQTDLIAVEVEVKREGKWTFYAFDRGNGPARAIPPGASCYSCHAQNGAVDNTFVQFYPTLQRIAQQKGTFRFGDSVKTNP